MAGVISLDDVIRIYSVLEAALQSEWQQAEYINFPRDERRILRFLSGYSNLTFSLYHFDFYATFGSTPELLPLQPTQRDVYSFCQIFSRISQNPNSLDRIERVVKVFVNTHTIGETPLVNYCWNRFCLVKEACQAIVYEDFKERAGESRYPQTDTYELVVELFSNINNKPFSLSDFGNEKYPLALAVENAAELLATLLLVSIDELYDFRKNIIAQQGVVGLQAYNFLPVADLYKAPRRYIEVMSTWDHLDDFMDRIVRARNGYLR